LSGGEINVGRRGRNSFPLTLSVAFERKFDGKEAPFRREVLPQLTPEVDLQVHLREIGCQIRRKPGGISSGGSKVRSESAEILGTGESRVMRTLLLPELSERQGITMYFHLHHAVFQ